jgi:hypothetical protein
LGGVAFFVRRLWNRQQLPNNTDNKDQPVETEMKPLSKKDVVVSDVYEPSEQNLSDSIDSA